MTATPLCQGCAHPAHGEWCETLGCTCREAVRHAQSFPKQADQPGAHLCVCGHSVWDHLPRYVDQLINGFWNQHIQLIGACKSCGHEKVIPSICNRFESSAGLSVEQIQTARVQLKPFVEPSKAEKDAASARAVREACANLRTVIAERLDPSVRAQIAEDQNSVLKAIVESQAKMIGEAFERCAKADEKLADSEHHVKMLREGNERPWWKQFQRAPEPGRVETM